MQSLKWHTEQRKVSTLQMWNKNPRTITDKGREDLHQSFSKFDYVEVIVINTDNRVIGGHRRLEELLTTGHGEDEIDVRVPNRKLTKKEFEELAIRLNKNTGEWNNELLAKFFEMDDLSQWGFDEFDLNKIYDGLLDANDDLFNLEEELEKITDVITKPGDLITLGKHKLLCADSTLPENWAALMGDCLATLQLTDPPYNVDYTGGTDQMLKIINDKMKDAAFLEFLTNYFAAANTVIRPGGSSYVFHADTEGLNFRNAFIAAGNKLAQCLVWVKNSIVMGRQDYHWQHEPILYGWKKGAGHKWFADRKQSTVLNFDRPLRNEDHPTMKPMELVGYLMKNSSAVNSIIIDGFLGSGTSIMVAEQLKRICRGMEMDPKYCDVIVNRYEKLTGRKAKRTAGFINIPGKWQQQKNISKKRAGSRKQRA